MADTTATTPTEPTVTAGEEWEYLGAGLEPDADYAQDEDAIGNEDGLEDDEPEESAEEVKTEDAPKEEAKTPPVAAPATQPEPRTTTPPAERPKDVDHLEAAGISKENTLGRKLVEALTKGGIDEVNKFMKVFGTDWDKVSDIDVVRSKVEQKYAALKDSRKRQLLVNRDMQKYDTSSFDDDARELAEADLELEASAIRDGYKAEQSSYKIPERNQPSAEELQQQQQSQQEVAAFEQKVLSDPYLAEFETSKSVKFGADTDAFNYATPDLDLKEALKTPFDEHFIKRDGNGKAVGFKAREYAMALALVTNPDKVWSELAKHYKEQGERKKDAKLRNLGRSKESAAPVSQEDGFQYLGTVK